MKDGIYFHMPEADYHKLERMSASGIKNMMISLPTFWAKSWMNPDREQDDEDTKAQILGRAYHCAFFEPDDLNNRYAGEPDLSEYDGLLTNDTMVKAELKAMGEAQSKAGESSLERAYRLIDHGYPGEIKSVILDQFEKRIGNRQKIGCDQWRQLHRDLARIKQNPKINELVTGGAAEVTILWTCPETGIAMKSRIDMLKPDLYIDLKSFANAMDKPIRKCIHDATAYNKYYLSMRVYQHAIEAIKTCNLDIQDSTSLKHTSLIEGLRMEEKPHAAWLFFQEKGGVPNLLARKLRFYQHPKGVDEQSIGAEDHQIRKGRSALAIKADMEIAHAKAMFKQAMEVYGPNEPWFPFEMIGEMTDEDFAPWFFDEVQR